MKRLALLVMMSTAVLAQSPERQPPTEKPLPTLSSTGLRNQSGEQLFQRQARADYALALELKDRRKYSAALRRFQDFRQLYPNHAQMPLVVGHIADIYEKLSRPESALKELRAFLKKSPEQLDVSALPLLARQADLEYRLGDWAESAASYQRLMASFPNAKEAEMARRRLAEMQSQPESVDSEQSAPKLPTPAHKEERIDESSLDRLGEGLDIEN